MRQADEQQQSYLRSHVWGNKDSCSLDPITVGALRSALDGDLVVEVGCDICHPEPPKGVRGDGQRHIHAIPVGGVNTTPHCQMDACTVAEALSCLVNIYKWSAKMIKW